MGVNNNIKKNENKEIVCVVCPEGCRLSVKFEDGSYIISGNKCGRGPIYAQKEMANPERMISSTVKINNGFLRRLPVKTKSPIPKQKIIECMREINRVEINGPIRIGDVIIKNVCGTGVDIIATREM